MQALYALAQNCVHPKLSTVFVMRLLALNTTTAKSRRKVAFLSFIELSLLGRSEDPMKQFLERQSGKALAVA